MKPNQHRIQSRKPGGRNWGTFEYTGYIADRSPLTRGSELSGDFPEADWRVQRYSDIRKDWVTVWTQLAEKPKPTELEHKNGITVREREEFPGALSLLGPDGWVFGYVSKNEADALRAYFASEGK